MSGKTNNTRSMYALLIGIDHYLPNELADGLYYGNLSACVNDVNEVEKFLRSEIQIEDHQIIKLTASADSEGRLSEPPEKQPTYRNIVRAFNALIEKADAGDQFYIHYSGHGGRATPKFRWLKGENGFDEVLVPTDIGNSEARYFRDIEFAYLIRKMLDKQLNVTIVLDSCHSGSATRAVKQVRVEKAIARGIGAIDLIKRPMGSLVATDEELSKNWEEMESQTKSNTRNLTSGSGWLLEPRGYVLLAACRASELAYEYTFNGGKPHGSLTYALLDSLRQLGPGATYKMLHDQIFAKVRSLFNNQTPQLQGEGNRTIFGSDHIQPYYAVNVLEVDNASERVLMNAGRAQGMHQGAEFLVFSPDTRDFKQLSNRQMLVTLTDIGATESWAKIVKKFNDSPIIKGSQAVLWGQKNLKLYRNLSLLQTPDLPESIDQNAALDKVNKAIEQESGRFLQVTPEGGETDFFVTVNAKGEYEILDASGSPLAQGECEKSELSGELLNPLQPVLRVDQDDAPAAVAKRLVHLTKYRNVLLLENNDRLSNIARSITTELAGYMEDYDPADRPHPIPFDNPNSPSVKAGEWIFLRVVHTFSSPLNITIIDLQPDYGITQMYPESPAIFEHLDPEQELIIPFRASLPSGYKKGIDVIKVFATIGTADFRWLQLPALDHQPLWRPTRGVSNDPLQAMIDSVTPGKLGMRTLTLAAGPSKQWFTRSVKVEVSSGS